MLLLNVKYGISTIILFCLAKATAFFDQNHKPALYDGENWFGIDVDSDTSLPKPLEPIRFTKRLQINLLGLLIFPSFFYF